jgi:hypothetical protein
MPRGTVIRLLLLVALLVAGIVFIWRTPIEPSRVTLLVTAVICAVTAIYAGITYEIFLQNQAMSQATTESAKVMERSLRFSYAANLLYRTLNTKDPTLATRVGFIPVDNDDYKRAMREYGEAGQQKEFVFAVVQNVGRGLATNVSVDARYNITDTNNANSTYLMTKQAAAQILEPGKAIALCIYVSRVPTADDRVEIISATITASDSYRDALSELPNTTTIEPRNHQRESDQGCLIHIA